MLGFKKKASPTMVEKQPASASYTDPTINGLQASFFSGYGKNMPRMGTTQLLKGYSELPWLRAVVSKKAEIGGAVKWHAVNDEGEITKQHPALKLWNKGNREMPGLVMRQTILKYLGITDEAYLWVDVNGRDEPVALWPIPPHWVTETPVANGNGTYKIEYKNFSADIPRRYIIRFYRPDPYMPYDRGVGAAHALADELESDQYASQHIKAFFYNNARPDLLISPESAEHTIGKDEAKRMEESWVRKLQGWWKAHKPFFSPGPVKVTPLGSSMRDMQMVDLRKWERDAVLQVYGFPKEALGVLDSTNRAGVEAAEFFLTKHSVLPDLALIREVMNMHLMVEFYNESYEIDFDSPVSEDKEHVSRVMRNSPFAFSVDEIRQSVGYSKLPDELGSVYVLPLNMVFSSEPGGGAIDVEPEDVEENSISSTTRLTQPQVNAMIRGCREVESNHNGWKEVSEAAVSAAYILSGKNKELAARAATDVVSTTLIEMRAARADRASATIKSNQAASAKGLNEELGKALISNKEAADTFGTLVAKIELWLADQQSRSYNDEAVSNVLKAMGSKAHERIIKAFKSDFALIVDVATKWLEPPEGDQDQDKGDANS